MKYCVIGMVSHICFCQISKDPPKKLPFFRMVILTIVNCSHVDQCYEMADSMLKILLSKKESTRRKMRKVFLKMSLKMFLKYLQLQVYHYYWRRPCILTSICFVIKDVNCCIQKRKKF